MEGLLRGPEVAEIEQLFRKAFNMGSGTVYFPVRHHSPACSFHLKRIIESYNPDVILIEGPSDTNRILEYIEHADSHAPLCIYYSYSDKKGVLGEKDGKYTCYYPFLDYSPELVAIREAKLRRVASKFIDLPYPEILHCSRSGKGLDSQSGKPSYNDDYLIQRSRFIQELCGREGCRNFSELWEKLFEMDALVQDTETFVRNMLAFCYLSRVGYTRGMLEEDGCLAREKYMIESIRAAAEKHSRILVVTGGFHTWGLIEPADEEVNIKPSGIDPDDSNAYAMAYSFEESDQLNGYASGMPYPAFYQDVWESICDNEEHPYEKTVLNFIVKCGHRLRKKDESISTADEIEAYNMARGLKSLRDKSGCGVYELIDSVKAAFIKGELSYSEKASFEVLRKLLTGRRTGRLCSSAEVPPIVRDFREKARLFRLKTDTTAEQEVVLDIYKKNRHREISKLLHMMLFMDTGFCKKVKGPDFINRKNTNLVRETWKYRWSTGVESSLIEASVYGGSLVEAAGAILAVRFNETGEHAGEASLLMIDAFMMGLDDNLKEIIPKVFEIINNDGTFYSIADCAFNLNYLCRARSLLGSSPGEDMDRLVLHAYNRAVMLIPGLADIGEGDVNLVISRLKDIYHVSIQNELGADTEMLGDALLTLADNKECESGIEGASLGLLLGMLRINRDIVIKRAEGYLYGTGEKFLKSAGFLKGLFSTARDIVFYDEGFIKGIDNVIRNIQEEDFLKLLPELRLSFSFFTPGEIDEIGKAVAGVYGTSREKILEVRAINPEDIRLGRELDLIGRKALKRWGMADEQQP